MRVRVRIGGVVGLNHRHDLLTYDSLLRFLNVSAASYTNWHPYTEIAMYFRFVANLICTLHTVIVNSIHRIIII